MWWRKSQYGRNRLLTQDFIKLYEYYVGQYALYLIVQIPGVSGVGPSLVFV
jgi:hypothetical protein